jgi:hypothetical protein
MNSRPYELLARFGSDGTVAGVHVRTIATVDGRDYEGDPIPLSAAADDPAFADFATQFSASVVTERDQLQAELNTANARIAELLQSMPWNPRVMEAKYFVARITAKEMLQLAASQDPQVQGILQLLQAYVDNDWPVILDSPEMQQAVAYLTSIGMVAQDRVEELLRDCTQAESYVADGL